MDTTTAARNVRWTNLWIEEADSGVWHLAVERLCRTHYRAACDAIVDLQLALIWPHKEGETGPLANDRCDGCLGLLLYDPALGRTLGARDRLPS